MTTMHTSGTTNGDPLAPLHRHILEPLLDGWYGRRTRAYVQQVERRLSLPREDMLRACLDAVRDLLRHAARSVPFYRARMEAAGFLPDELEDLAGLAALPRVTRADVAAHAGALRSSRYRRRALVEARSGGTTAAPVPFLQTSQAIWRKNAAATVLRRRMGWTPGARVAFLWGAVEDMPQPATGSLRRMKSSLVQHVDRTLMLPAADLRDARLDEYAVRLERFRPRVLQAYPSAADLLARRILETGCRVEIPRVVLTAETVFPAQRARIAEAFGAEVFSFYGAREVGWIAAECSEAHRLHLNTDGIHVEADADGRLLVTDLVNDAMPLIRYEIGDRGAIRDEPCACGDPRPLLTDLGGRVNDVFTLPSGRRVPGSICDVRNYQLVDGIVETQLIQERPDRMRVRWVAGPNFEPVHLEGLRRWLDGCFDGELTYEFERAERIEPGPNGKMRYCVSRIGQAS